MRTRRTGFAVLALFAAPSLHLAAQRAASPSADSVARAFFHAIAGEQWSTAARYLDLEAFQPFVSQALEWVRQSGPTRAPTLEDILRNDPDMPREVAEYHARKFQEYARAEANPLPRMFAGVASADSLAALPLDRAAAAWLQAQDDRTQLRELSARNQCPTPPADSLARAASHQVLGVLAVNDSVAYALHQNLLLRTAPGETGLPAFPPQVLELRRRNGAWRVIPSEELLRPMNRSMMDVTCARPPARRIRP
jgi:hypothetical protein